MSVKHHPATLWWLSALFSLFMYAYGGIFASLVLYLHRVVGLDLKQAYTLFGAFASLMWTLPWVGGALASRWGLTRMVGLGAVVIALGAVLMLSHQLSWVLVGLSLFLAGNAFYTPGLWCLVDYAYAKSDVRRESGFTYFYLLFNVGAGIGIFGGGLLALHAGYAAALQVNAVAVVLAGLGYAWFLPVLQCDASRTLAVQPSCGQSLLRGGASAAVASLLALFLLLHAAWNNKLIYALYVLAIAYVLRLAWMQKQAFLRTQYLAFTAWVLLSLVFWSLYTLEPSLLAVFVEKHVVRHVWGVVVPSSAFFAFDCFFIVVVGLIMARAWARAGAARVAVPVKFALSIALMGVGFLWLDAGMHFFGMASPLPFLWMFVTYAFFSTGDLMIGPIGMAMVGKMAPQGKEGVLMGVWQLSIGFSAVLGSELAKQAVVPKAMPFVEASARYRHLFFLTGSTAVGIAALVLLGVGVRHVRLRWGHLSAPSILRDGSKLPPQDERDGGLRST